VTENLTLAFMSYLIDISGFSINRVLKSPILSPKGPQKVTENLTLAGGLYVPILKKPMISICKMYGKNIAIHLNINVTRGVL